ncbi:MAG TPA: MBL fold metallo-hydrolase, partial [Chitinophagales bacterium]|nr:MBL fold metallo-hydrolase [Chitinophagales bacterium]
GEASLEKSINQLGYSLDEVTDVILSHLHFDHCGGAIWKNENGAYSPAFKNATYWSNEKHWEWATKPNAREKASFLKENILPIQESGQLKFTNDGSTEVNPNITLKTVSGHTESMFTPLINKGSKTIVYCADLIPSMAHIPIPYVMAYDTRPLLTLDEKQKFLTEAVTNNYYLFFEHDRVNELCSLKQTERGVRENEVMKLSEL